MSEREHGASMPDGAAAASAGGPLVPAQLALLEAQLRAARDDAARRELLVEELNHRIKNTYALVQAVAAQSARHASTVPAFLASFGTRLQALARATDELIRGGSDDMPLRRLAESTLAAHGGENSRLAMNGASVEVPQPFVSTVCLILHELATNAVKYGSLSTPEGRVAIAWTVSAGCGGERELRLAWQESGGPEVHVPDHRGFGSRLLSRGLPRGVRAELSYDPAGLECLITFQLGPAMADGARPSLT